MVVAPEVSHASNGPYPRIRFTHLCSVRKIGGLCIVHFDGFGVEIYSCGPVVLFESFVALVFEGDCLRLVFLGNSHCSLGVQRFEVTIVAAGYLGGVETNIRDAGEEKNTDKIETNSCREK